MSWYSKVVWREGLFLRPHHFQQHDRYVERLVERRTRFTTPYPWGFAEFEIDRDLAQQSKFALRRAVGVLAAAARGRRRAAVTPAGRGLGRSAARFPAAAAATAQAEEAPPRPPGPAPPRKLSVVISL